MGRMTTATDLPSDGVHAFDPAGQATRLAIHAGTAWITQAGDAHDHIIAAPAVFCPGPRGRVVVQALGTPLRFTRIGLSKTG